MNYLSKKFGLTLYFVALSVVSLIGCSSSGAYTEPSEQYFEFGAMSAQTDSAQPKPSRAINTEEFLSLARRCNGNSQCLSEVLQYSVETNREWLDQYGTMPAFQGSCYMNGACDGVDEYWSLGTGTVQVDSYYRSDGTYVRSHHRRAPRR